MSFYRQYTMKGDRIELDIKIDNRVRFYSHDGFESSHSMDTREEAIQWIDDFVQWQNDKDMCKLIPQTEDEQYAERIGV